MRPLSNHYLIVANGDFVSRKFITEASEHKTIIALDKAADKLFCMGIMPHILLGDFDCDDEAHKALWGIRYTKNSLSEDQQPYAGKHGVMLVPRKNQDFTDLMKAIQYCDENNASSITIVCATGGRLDHHEAALRSLRVYYQKNREIILHTDSQSIRFIKNESFTFHGRKNDKCAILAFPYGILSTHGLTYDVSNYELNFGYSESIANSLRLTEAQVEVQGEALLIMPGQLIAQR